MGLFLVIAGLLFAVLTRRPKMYHAEVGLLITEGVKAGDGRPRPRGELRAFVNDVIFVTARLEKLVDKHDLMRKLRQSSMAMTLTKVRGLIEVNVWQDYFEIYRQSTDPPRSARVNVGFSAPDPKTALAVAQELGELVAETQSARDLNAAEARVDGLRVMAERAVERATRQREELERENLNVLRHPTPFALLRLRQLTEAVRAAETDSRTAVANLFDAQLRKRETQKSRRLVEVVDPGVPIWQTVSSRRRLVGLGALSLSLALLLAVIAVGAFDPTVQDEQDLRRAGLLPLGSILVCSNASSDDRL